MAASSYEATYKKYFGNRFDNISHDATEEDIRQLFDDWASEYDQVTTIDFLYHFVIDQTRLAIILSGLFCSG